MNEFWDKIEGHQNQIKLLSRIADSGKVPHSFIFNGLNGTGKEFFAIQFSLYLNRNEININPSILKQITNLQEPFIKYIFPLPRGKGENDDSTPYEKLSQQEIDLIKKELDKKILNPYYKLEIPSANNIKISSIRDIKKFISMNYDDLKYRIIIISDAHLMSDEAQNSLLKSLEEPPPGVIIILITNRIQQLRSTIISRCRLINFEALSNESIKNILIKYYRVDENIAEKSSKFSEGSVQNAVELIDNDLDFLIEKTISILRNSFGKKFHTAIKEINSVIKDRDKNNEKEKLKIIIKLILFWLNDAAKQSSGYNNFYFENNSETFTKFNDRYPEVNILPAIFTIDKYSNYVDSYSNLNLLVLNIIFELSAITATKK